MDETPCFMEIGFNTTIDFTGKKNIDIETSERDHYRISVILSITGNGYKFPPFIIIKGESGKTIEKELNKIWFVKEKLVYIICQTEGWGTNNIFY